MKQTGYITDKAMTDHCHDDEQNGRQPIFHFPIAFSLWSHCFQCAGMEDFAILGNE